MLHTVGAVPSRRAHTSTQPARTRSGGKGVCERDGVSRRTVPRAAHAWVRARARQDQRIHSFTLHATLMGAGRRRPAARCTALQRPSCCAHFASINRILAEEAHGAAAVPFVLRTAPRRTCVRRERSMRREGRGAIRRGRIAGKTGQSRGRRDRPQASATSQPCADERSKGMPASACGTPSQHRARLAQARSHERSTADRQRTLAIT